VQFLNGRGELITAGGRTVKNVAGYDLTKFMVGQRDVFGKLLTITTRTYRRPTGAMLVRHPPDVKMISRLIPSSIRPHWAVLTAEALLLGYLGDEPQLAFYRTAVAATEPSQVIERTLEEDVSHRSRLWNLDGAIVFRASVPPARLGEIAPKLTTVRWAADAAFGIVVGTLESDIAPVRDIVAALDGTLKLLRGPFGPPIELSTTPAERQIIQRLKAAFDPENKLNPLPWSAIERAPSSH
jgi:FAD/FMN-containing dehydrogenase